MGILGAVGAAQAFANASGGKVYVINTLGTTPIQVIALNSQRITLTFHNPGTIDAFVAPLNDANGVALNPTLVALGGCFVVYAGSTLVLTGECQKAWQAFSRSGSNNPLTVMDSNV